MIHSPRPSKPDHPNNFLPIYLFSHPDHKILTWIKDYSGTILCVFSLAKVGVNDIHCSFLLHNSSHFITDGNQVGQASFTLGKPMVTVPSHLLICVHINVSL